MIQDSAAKVFDGVPVPLLCRDDANLGVVIPVRIDSPDRLSNLGIVLEYFVSFFPWFSIIVIEHGPRSYCAEIARGYGQVDFRYVTSSGCFHKSRVCNLGIALATTPVVMVHDCDVLFPPEALIAAIRKVTKKEVDFIFPYNGIMLQCKRDKLLSTKPNSLSLFTQLPHYDAESNTSLPADVELLYGGKEQLSTGGGILFDRQQMIWLGGFNENMVSYGCEDMELLCRLQKLNVRISYLAGFNCYHLEHQRGNDSHYNHFLPANQREWQKIAAMSREELWRYIQNNFKYLVLDARHEVMVYNTADEFSIRRVSSAKIELPDVLFFICIPHNINGLHGLINRLCDRMEANYKNYEFHIIEIGSYHYRQKIHRPFVIYRHSPLSLPWQWLKEITDSTQRSLIVWVDLAINFSPDLFCPALDDLRNQSTSILVHYAAVEDPPLTTLDSRQARTQQMFNRLLPTQGLTLMSCRQAIVERWEQQPLNQETALSAHQFQQWLEQLSLTQSIHS